MDLVFAGGRAGVAAAIANFIPSEVADVADRVLGPGGFATGGHGTVIAMVWIVAIIDVAIEAATAVVPGASADEDAVQEPVRSVVAPGSAGIRGVVIVAVGAYRSGPNLNSNLSLGCGWACGEADSDESCNDRKTLESVHIFSSLCRGRWLLVPALHIVTAGVN